jgi:O-antigen/teichoic acid export membrane protein
VYAIADQISHLMAWAGLLAGKMMLPEAASDDDGRRSLAKLGLAARLLIAVLLGASIFAAAVGVWLIPALFGPEFASAYVAMLILLPSTLARALHALIATWLQGRGVQRPVIRASAVAVAIEAIVVAIAALTLGWLGVAVAKSGAYLIQLGIALRALRAYRREHDLADDPHGLPGGRWLLDRDDVAALRRWIVSRAQRSG